MKVGTPRGTPRLKKGWRRNFRENQLMMEPGSVIQHWLRPQVSQYVKRQTALHQMQPGSTSVVIREIREEETQTENELALNIKIASGSQSKRGVELCVMEIHQSPHKRSKNVDSSEERKKEW